MAWLAVAARLATAAGDAPAAARHGERARALHDELIAQADPAWRAAMRADPERPAAPSTPAAPADAEERAHLRRLVALSRRLNAETRLAPLLGEIIDAAIELTGGERGVLLLADDAGTLEVAIARNFDARDLADDDPARSPSRSIAARAAASGEPVITVDAGADARFDDAMSVAALRLRSVVAVPLRQKGRVIGCVYVDHRLRRGAFDEGAALRLLDLADLAGAAIDNARLADALRERSEEAAALGARLAAELADRELELARARADLADDRARLRHAYPAIVGRSPALVAMLAQVDRAAASSLPVVLVGESGTGKELVARALHEHSARVGRPFVAINCGALPETLLESELFGHVRGAFTGADRERAGLFEIADGGTLLLDEIADTSAGMQARLLRVLQEGRVRRVGDHRERAVDVRVVAASQQPLGELVAAGRLRDDLRYRLEVIPIEVPPLRAREGDIPLLAQALLARLAPTPPRLTHAATRALAAHAWPGNVRELENALARAIALGGDVIDLEDLPDAVLARRGRTPTAAPDDLRLRPAIDELERSYLAAAMARAGGNQTVAARLLGLSRFGLQKKLRRLAE
ncbi:MAG: sigma 54-interacting transcriptional regulator [Kofleriaceae bacterium]